MIVGDPTCAINLVSSILLSGACCVYEMQAEKKRSEEHQEEIRRAIRSEWERNKKLDMQEVLKHKKMSDQSFHLSQHRRQRLMNTKIRASKKTPLPVKNKHAIHGTAERRQSAPIFEMDSSFQPRQRSEEDISSHASTSQTSMLSQTSFYSAPLPEYEVIERREPMNIRCSSVTPYEVLTKRSLPNRHSMSSLMDESDDDEGFEEIQLQ
jgi:hypothetical protein